MVSGEFGAGFTSGHKKLANHKYKISSYNLMLSYWDCSKIY